MMSDLVTVRQFANEHHIPFAWLKSAARSGTIPCLRIGRRILLSREATEKRLAELAAGGKVAANDP